VTHCLSPEKTLLGGIRHDGEVAGGKGRVKLGKVGDVGGENRSWSGQLRKVRSCLGQVPLAPTMYMTNMPLLESCIAVSQFDLSQWQNG
jgi:hypothetical protein